MVCLRAALNNAMDEGWITTDTAWKRPLKPIKDADGRRDVYLTREERQVLIDAARPDIALFLRLLCSLPLRPGAAASINAGDFNPALQNVIIRVDKAGSGRTIALPDSTAQLFKEAAADKLPSAPLFARWDGERWDKDRWKQPIRQAVEDAGLAPGTSAYAIRHSVITDLASPDRDQQTGKAIPGTATDLATVATLAGTSLRMIYKHYHHLQDDLAEAALEKVAL